LLENIAGANEPNLDRARDVLEQIGVLEHFERRLSGLLSPVIGAGQALSAGERQLVAFARALYRDAPILLLDEATASIDSDTEKRLQKALEVSLEKRTAIVIAHRLGTIRTADRILVLSHGRLVEQGTHRALVAQDGLYRRLVRLSSVREGVIVD
jgi:ATP-binding cassette subfamily B protein